MRIIRFIKDWTLPTAIFFGVSLYFVFAYIPALDGASRMFLPMFSVLLPAILFLVLFVTFCKVDFTKMRPRRWHLWISIMQMFLALLLLSLVLVFDLRGNSLILCEAVMMCVLGPCAAAAPVVTSKLGGNLEDMTSYVFISNLITALIIPAILPLLHPTEDVGFSTAFALILYRVCIILLVPMLVAYIVKHHLHKLHRRIIGIKDLSFYLWSLCLCIVTGTTVRNIVHSSSTPAFVLLVGAVAFALCVLQFSLGRAIGRHTGSSIECGQALGQKNTAFSIWLSNACLSPLSSVGPGCYILWQNIVNSLELWQQRKEKQRR